MTGSAEIFEQLALKARSSGQLALTEPEGKAVLGRFGIAVPRGVFAETGDDAAARCADLTFPVAVKAVAPGLVHKSDARGTSFYT